MLNDESMAALREWEGRTEQRLDVITAAPVRGLAATLDLAMEPRPGDPLPLLWHWLYFVPAAPQGTLRPDGHPRGAGFLPPVPLPRRLWAGTRFEWHRPLRIGDEVTRVSRIASVRRAEGRSGELVFVVVRHELSTAAGLCVVEEQDMVYRGEAGAAARPAATAASTDAASPPAAQGTWSRQLVPDEVLLFRYSALTFNAHRIHYDRRHAMEVEGHADLVVQGALVATLMLQLLQDHQPARTIVRFEMRAVRPAFANRPLRIAVSLAGEDGAEVWASDGDGVRTMQGRVAFDKQP